MAPETGENRSLDVCPAVDTTCAAIPSRTSKPSSWAMIGSVQNQRTVRELRQIERPRQKAMRKGITNWWKPLVGVTSLILLATLMIWSRRERTPTPPTRMQPLHPQKVHSIQVGQVATADSPSTMVEQELRVAADSWWTLRGSGVLGDEFKLALLGDDIEIAANTGGWPKEPTLVGRSVTGEPCWRPVGAPVKMMCFFYRAQGLSGKPGLVDGRTRMASAGCDIESRKLTFEALCQSPTAPGRYELQLAIFEPPP